MLKATLKIEKVVVLDDISFLEQKRIEYSVSDLYTSFNKWTTSQSVFCEWQMFIKVIETTYL